SISFLMSEVIPMRSISSYTHIPEAVVMGPQHKRVLRASSTRYARGRRRCDAAPGGVELFDRVFLVEERVRPDFLGVSRHHRVDQLLHLRAVRESDALELASLLQRVELGAVFGGLDLSAISAGFFAGLDDGRLQLGRKFLEGLGRETD